MKKVFLLFLIFSFIPLSVFAHDGVTLVNEDNEVYVGYGYPKTLSTTFINGFVDIFATLFSLGQNSQTTTGPGVAQLGYNRFLTDNIAVGALFTFEPCTITNKTGEEEKVTKQGTFTIQGNFKFQYGWDRVKLYHGLSMGLGLIKPFDNTTVTPTFTMNIVPIGVKVRIVQGFNLFADMGLWSTALINAGVMYTF